MGNKLSALELDHHLYSQNYYTSRFSYLQYHSKARVNHLARTSISECANMNIALIIS